MSLTFVTTGVCDAIRQTKETEKDVNIIGSALTTPLCLRKGLVDELQVDRVPWFLPEMCICSRVYYGNTNKISVNHVKTPPVI